MYSTSTGHSLQAQRARTRRALLFAAAGGKCFYCGKPVFHPQHLHERDWIFPNKSLSQMVREHKSPSIRGGEDTNTNIVCGCVACNSAKGAFDLQEFRFVTGLRMGSLSFRFAGEPSGERRDWIVCHSPEQERALLVHNIPKAEDAYRLRNSFLRGPKGRQRA